MLDKLLGKVKEDGLVLQEVITDKDSSINGTFCRHFLEGAATYFLTTVRKYCTKTWKK